MNHRVSSIKNIRTITALRGEAVRIDLQKTYQGTLQAWMKRDPNSDTHRVFDIDSNRYLVLPIDRAKDYVTSSGVTIDAVYGKWYFDVELTDLNGNTKTICTGKIFFENDITGSNSIELLDSSNLVALTGELNTVELGKTVNQRDPNSSTEADFFVLNNPDKQLFWHVEVPAFGALPAVNKQYWYSFETSKWVAMDEIGDVIILTSVPTYDSLDLAQADLTAPALFRLSQNNLDGVPSPGGTALHLLQ